MSIGVPYIVWWQNTSLGYRKPWFLWLEWQTEQTKPKKLHVFSKDPGSFSPVVNVTTSWMCWIIFSLCLNMVPWNLPQGIYTASLAPGKGILVSFIPRVSPGIGAFHHSCMSTQCSHYHLVSGIYNPLAYYVSTKEGVILRENPSSEGFLSSLALGSKNILGFS